MSFINNAEQDIKNEVDKVEDKFDSVFHKGEQDVKVDEQDVAKDATEVEAEVKVDGETVIHDVTTDVKQEETLVKDAEQHPFDIPTDAKTGLTDAEHDVTHEVGVVAQDTGHVAQDVSVDVQNEAQKIAEQLKADFAKAQAAGPGHELTDNETPQAWANRINQPTESTNLDAAPDGPGPVPTQAQSAADEVTAQRQAEVEQALATTAAQQPQNPVAPEPTATTTDAAPDTHASTGNVTVTEAEDDEAVEKAQNENLAAHEDGTAAPVETTPAASADGEEQHV